MPFRRFVNANFSFILVSLLGTCLWLGDSYLCYHYKIHLDILPMLL
jgi:hypothetical protein